eukprot:Sspe_Gene.8599::Locus_2911_Transcript_1_1_Confidence_1.000_Length_1912::g.8599::m.8599/K05283/PIGW; phosphatidylinositol glycan, class W
MVLDDGYKEMAEARLAGQEGGAWYQVFATCWVIVVVGAVDLHLGASQRWTWQVAEAAAIIACIAGAVSMQGTVLCLLAVLPLLCFALAHPSDARPARPPHITVYRAGLMLLTSYCILAVDFPSFPTEHMKTEVYGVSLMDAGVGSFVFAYGMVHFRKRLGAKWWSRTAPLVAMGLARVVMVKGANYQEHVTEYGVHWNFFLTLAVLPLAATERIPWWLITGVHQLLLSFAGGTEYLLDEANRTHSIISANKEGLASLPGYLALLSLGNRADGYVWAGGLGALSLALHFTVQPVSRRFCNAAYVTLVGSLNTFIVTSLSHLPVTHEGGYVLRQVNRHSLLTFLVANLLTGAINLAIPTLHAPPMVEAGVLCAYMAAVIAVPALVG